MYPKMHEILKPKESMNFKVEHFEVSEESAKMCRLRDTINRKREYEGFEAGTYVRLCDKNISSNMGVMMSNTPMEMRTNEYFVHKANGNVLIAGLGLGMVVLAIQDKPEVKSILVIEKYKEVIDLVVPQLPLNNKVKIINSDIFNWQPNGHKFDTIYFDIWNDITGDNYPEMKKLHRKFCRKLNRDNPHFWIDSWRKYDCKMANRSGDRFWL